MAVHVHAHRGGAARVVGDRAQREPGATPAEERGHRRDADHRHHRGGDLAGRERHAAHGHGGGGQIGGQGRGREQERDGAPQHHAEAEGDHDGRDERTAHEPSDDRAMEGHRRRHARRGGEAGGGDGPEAQRGEPGGQEARAQHRPFPQREIDHAGGLVHDHECQREQGVDRAREESVHHQGDEEQHAPRTLAHRASGVAARVGAECRAMELRPWNP